jgi:putative membrane protein
MLLLEDLPALNATLNSITTVLLLAGWICIKLKKQSAHIALMILALIVSTGFLTSYLYYHYHVGSVKFAGQDPWVRKIYFFILITHVVLAIVNLPLIISTVVLAARRRYVWHRRLARWTLPSWLYVSVTGVLVYFMCYQWYVRG